MPATEAGLEETERNIVYYFRQEDIDVYT